MRHIFKCIDAHTCGNPVRVVIGGGPKLIGKDMNEKRQHFIKEFDWIRKGLMFEPRGHDQMSGSILYPPHLEENDMAILFIETSGSLPMCGHGTIGTITVAIQEGLVQPKTPGKVNIETPAGMVYATYQQRGDKVDWVRFDNVKSYVAAENLEVESPDLGKIVFDVAYGGNFYGIIDPQKNFSGIENFTAGQLIQYSQALRKLMNDTYPDAFIHPENNSIRDVSHLLWTGNALDPSSSGRNAVFYGGKAIDRSPCGTGTSARMVQWYHKGKLKKGEDFIHESYIGSKFIGRIMEETNLSGKKAIIPSIKGWAKITGYNEIIIDSEDDPYAFGFQVL
jgi:4-hydroxyproline epimerase